jgi:hypothetical protein
MSSLQMGQTRRELAAAAPTGPLLASRAILDAISSVSVVEVWELDASDRELSEGVSWWGRWGLLTAGDSERPLPKTLPPPSVRRDAMGYAKSARGRQADESVECLVLIVDLTAPRSRGPLGPLHGPRVAAVVA